ncbi:ABC transporter permease [Dyadobacter arcticus]|uniref:ABC transport system permease protein n=1 Tax=Dyadobacter arcticus TaxID=1078754 RepID=A0ABX0UFY3_9BACT|nr:ABC transporter permease [Dyadobacter arcticus]NIJ51822.1 putative ABC transport system permease protein [Dyadobacter arcticus]
MLLNYFKIAFRNLTKNATYSLINIVGLALGMAVSALIFLFVMHELSYDRFHSNHQRIFRITGQAKIGENDLKLAAFPTAFGPAIKAGNAGVVDYVRLMQAHGKAVIKNPEKPTEMFFEEHFLYADSSIFKVFSFKLKEGNPDQALDKPNSVVISETIAEKYFGSDDPVGKTLIYDGGKILQVTGVAENTPSNSSLNFDFLVPIDAFPFLNGVDKAKWAAGGNFNTYLLLNSEKNVASVENTINKVEKEKRSIAEQTTYSLENLTTIHLGNNAKDPGNTKLIYIFAGIAVLILSLALFNYMSLTTARATVRAKEVGVRKVIGSGRKGLVQQFYAESVLVCILAFLLAFVLVEILRNSFYELLDLRIDISFLLSPTFLGFLATLFCITVLVAGSYPAMILSGFAPLDVLKGRFAGGQKGAGIRKMFMVFQFTVSIALIVCSLVVKNQVTYMQNKKLGLQKDQVLSIPLTENASRSLFTLRDEIAGQVGVQSASIASSGLFEGYNIWFLKSPGTMKDVSLVNYVTDEYFVKTLGLEWKIAPVPGTFKSRSHMFLNEVAVKELGIQKNPIGKTVPEMEEVAGVLKNFHFTSPQDGIKPMGLIVANDTTNFGKSFGSNGILYTRLDPRTDTKEKVKAIGEIFAKYYPEKPFEYYFLDDAFNKTFKTEIRMSKMFAVFTALAIFIAGMGLFGLVTFTAENRTKEIGIRKVLGASVAGIVALLSKDFVKLICISIIIALPVSRYFMDKWLQDFTYRIQISVWVYLFASIGTIAIAIITISFQSIKAALMNPVKSLRSE